MKIHGQLVELFFIYYDEITDIQFLESLELILDLLRDVLEEDLFLTHKEVVQLIDNFIEQLPGFLKEKLIQKKDI
jgi:hypothetical protein